MTDRHKRKRLSLTGSGGGHKKPVQGTTLVEQATSEMQQLQQNGNLQLASYFQLHCRESLLAYLEECPLLQACDSVNGLNSDDFVEPFVRLVVSRSQPLRGVCFALKTYMAALQTLVSEAMGTVVARDNPRLRPAPLLLTLEEEPLETMRAIARSNLLHSGEVSISDDRNMLALYNDRELDYMSRYAECNQSQVVFFTLTLCGRLVQTMVVPPCEHQYELQLRANHHIRSYGTLEAELRDLRQQLAKQPPVEAKTAVDEAKTELAEAKTQLAVAQAKLVKQETKIAALEKQAEGLKEVARKAVEKAMSGKKAKPRK